MAIGVGSGVGGVDPGENVVRGAPSFKIPKMEDPNLWSIVLGMIGQAAMGEHQQSWQSQLGGAATALGRSRKTALAAGEIGKGKEEDRALWRRYIESLINGGEPTAEAPGMEGLGLSSPAGGFQPEMGGTVYPYTQRRRVEREEPLSPFGGGELNIFDVLSQ